MDEMHCVVIGAGVVGLAVAAQLAQQGYEVLVLEQHDLIGSETSSRNSEVIHAGIYYPTGSHKARLCVQGKHLLYEFCRSHGVPHARCGKLIVAVDEQQVPTVRGYMQQAAANGVDDLRWLDQAELQDYEPAVCGVGAAWSPSTGIIDSHAFMLALQGEMEAHGGMVVLNTEVTGVDVSSTAVKLHTPDLTLQARWVVNCAGLRAPELVANWPTTPKPYYAKGHYYAYSGHSPFQHLVYPVAESGGLGVHVTLDLAQQAKFGPDVRWIDAIDYGFEHTHFDQFVHAIQRYYPALDVQRLHPSYTGIRPKVAAPDAGFQDFQILGPGQHGQSGWINLFGIESPGLTAALAIARQVGAMVAA